ncbi:hypothetical protein BCR34DRAFT_563688 [Clohesyomyces aquaticus]|uniref:Uncharacterized protein n=1 Tax=Clohesyomyces aquaticus TaxID=1231657 RepID=A0A1Y1ZQ79_9PLEO|nr:hypothetical protein BCR34DRAFT_563688 [Clohesyomyces aquaticus]
MEYIFASVQAFQESFRFADLRCIPGVARVYGVEVLAGCRWIQYYRGGGVSRSDLRN